MAIDIKYYFNVSGQDYSSYQQVAVPQNCNGVTVINKGDVAVSFNGIWLQPNPTAGLAGESIAVGGNAGEVFAGLCTIFFAAGGTNPLVNIVFKYYTEKDRM